MSTEPKRRAPDPATRRPRSKKPVVIAEAKGADAGRFPWTRAFRGSKIPMNAKAVGLVAASYGNADGSSNHPGLTRLARDFDVDEKTIRRHLETLERAGWMRRTHAGRAGLTRKDADDYQLTIPQAAPMLGAADEEPPEEPPEWQDGEPDPHDDQWTELSTSSDGDQWTIYDRPVDKIVQTPRLLPTKENHGVTSRGGVASATPNGSHGDHGIPADAVTAQRGSSKRQPKGNKSRQRGSRQRILSEHVTDDDRSQCNWYIDLLPRITDDDVDDALWNLWEKREDMWIWAFTQMRKKFGGPLLPKPYVAEVTGYVEPDTPEQARYVYMKGLRLMSRNGAWHESLTDPLELLGSEQSPDSSPRAA